MKIPQQILTLGSIELLFLFDQAHHPIIEFNGRGYSTLFHLLQDIPELGKSPHIETFAQIANFLAKGVEFHYIKNIEGFKKNYWQEIEKEKFSPFRKERQLKHFGTFDLSDMHPPILLDQRLTFFVKHDYLSIPYRASLFFPIREELFQMTYELLPLLHKVPCI